MRTYPKWMRKIKLVALYGGGGCFGLFVILVIVALVTGGNEESVSGSASESPTAAATAPESPSVVASGRAGATGADLTETEALRCGAPVNLFEAAKSGTACEVKAALAAGADSNARNEIGNTPLHYAATGNDNLSVIKALIEGGANPGARDKYGRTPLHVATAGYNIIRNPAVLAVTAALIEGGADPNASDENGQTPLHMAAVKGTASLIKALIEAGADPDEDSDFDHFPTPLHVAAKLNSNPSVIKALIEGGANPAARDYDGKVPFDYAEDNETLKETEAYWLLNDGRFE